MPKPNFATALTAAILIVRNQLVASGQYPNFEAINAGYCADFADDVAAELTRQGWENPNNFISQLDIQMFLSVNPTTGFAEEAGPFDVDLLATHWPKVIPPGHLIWNDLEQISADAGFCSGTHVWISHKNKFYDSETPQGVENFFDLPFFKRIIADWTQPSAIAAE